MFVRFHPCVQPFSMPKPNISTIHPSHALLWMDIGPMYLQSCMSRKEHVGTYDSWNDLNGVPQSVSIECGIVDPKTFGFYVKNAIKCDIGQGHYIMTTLTWIPLYKINKGYIYIYMLMPQCHSPCRSFESLRHFRSEVGQRKGRLFCIRRCTIGVF